MACGDFPNSTEQEVAGFLCALSDFFVAAAAASSSSRVSPERLSWGRRRARTRRPGEPPEEAAAPAAAASPDTPLAFPASGGEEEAAAPAGEAKKPRRHKECLKEQSGVVEKLCTEKDHLLRQVDEYRARLESSRAMNEKLKQMQSKLKQQQQAQSPCQSLDQIQARQHTPRPVMQEAANAAEHLGRHLPLRVDLNAPARALSEEASAASMAAWCRGWQTMYKAAAAAEARRRRRLIRRAKNPLWTTAATSPCGMRHAPQLR